MNMNGYIGYYPKFSVYPDEKVRKGVTTHTLTYSPGTAASLLIVIGGVLQEPDEAYTVSGNTVTFAEPVPDTGWIQYRSIETSSDFTKVLEPVLKRLDALEGVGGLPIFEEKTASYTATRSSAVSLKMSDGVNKTVTVDQTMISDDWFAIDLTDWKRSSELLTVTIDFGSQALSSGDASFDKLIVDYPCTLYFQKVGTVWKITDGAGLAGGYAQIEKRITALETPPKSLFKGNEFTGNSLTESLRNYRYINITGVTSFGGIQHEFNTLVLSSSISSKGKYEILSFSGANPTQEWIYLFLSFPTDSSFTLHGGTHPSSGWTRPAISSIIGVNRL